MATMILMFVIPAATGVAVTLGLTSLAAELPEAGKKKRKHRRKRR